MICTLTEQLRLVSADHGFGCNIHPSAKQFCSVRLAHAALAQVYAKDSFADWKSPSYKSAAQSQAQTRGSVSLSVSLSDVSATGLKTLYPFNYASPQSLLRATYAP
jgi:hypothetical protein